MDFLETTEQRDLQAAVAAIARRFGGRYCGLTRLLRIAPVNRETILNHVAQHSLGQPRSY